MKNTKDKKKRITAYGWFLWIYVGLWLVVTVVICSIIWKKLSAYQEGYDNTKALCQPELAMNDALMLFTSDNIGNIVDEMDIQGISRFEDRETYIEFYRNLFADKKLVYFVNIELNSDTRPVYDIYSIDEHGNKELLLAVVSLKKNAKEEAYGFHKWMVGKVAVSENYYEYKDVFVRVFDDMQVLINGQTPNEDELVYEGALENSLSDIAYELTGKTFGYKVYYVGDLIKEPVLSVIDANGRDITDEYVVGENGLRDYLKTAPDEFVSEEYDYVKDFCQKYIYHIYRKASVDSVASLMEDGSEAKRLLYDAQATLAWAWVPKTVEILSEDYTEFVVYNDEYFSCKCVANVRKSDDKTVEEEEFACRILFKKVAGKWLVTYLRLG